MRVSPKEADVITTIDIVGRCIIGSCILLGLSLGIKMLFRKEEVLCQVDDGFSKHRWILEFAVAVLAVWYVVHPQSRPSFMLIWQFPDWVKGLGLFVVVIAWTVRVWAQFSLGQMWSEKIRLLRHHRVIKSGPYRYIKHPIYWSYFPLSVGLLFLTEDWVMFLAAIWYTLLSLRRTLKEEDLMKLYSGVGLPALYQKAREEENRMGRMQGNTITEIVLAEHKLKARIATSFIIRS